MIFVSLQVEMKERSLRFSAMLLVLWYCFSVIGFNVHTCNASGRAFVATFISGLTCADIHPEHHCDKEACGTSHETACCPHHHEEGVHVNSLRPADCCSDDHMALALTGCATGDNNRHGDAASLCICSICGSPVESVSCVSSASSNTYGIFSKDKPLLVMRDRQSLLNIWRI